MRRAVDRLTMEELALAGETDPASVERLEALRKDMADRKNNSTPQRLVGSRRRQPEPRG